MRIGVDIDGVLNYRQEFVVAYGTKFCVEKGLSYKLNLAEHSIKRMFGLTQAERDEFWLQYAKNQMWIWPAQCFAAEVIHKLRAEGHEIFIITGRNNRDPRIEEMPETWTWEDVTKDWLARNGVEYDGIAFDLGRPVPNDKGTYCAEHKIDVMIEDLPEYLETLAGKTKILVYDQPYNQQMDLPQAQRVYSWYDAYAKIKQLEQI